MDFILFFSNEENGDKAKLNLQRPDSAIDRKCKF